MLLFVGVTSMWGVDYELMLTLDVAGASDGTMTEITSASDLKTFLQDAAPAASDIKSVGNTITKIYDAKGSGGGAIPNNVLKVGTSTAAGAFSFTIADSYDNVKKVVVVGYGWKNTSTISVNSATGQTYSTAQVEHEYVFDGLTATKTISISVTTSCVCITEIRLYKESTNPTVSVEQSGSAITEVDFGDVEKDSQIEDYGYSAIQTINVKGSNLTDDVNLEITNAAGGVFSIWDPRYASPTQSSLTIKPTAGAIDTTVVIAAYTSAVAGEKAGELTVSSAKETPEFTAITIDLTANIVAPVAVSSVSVANAEVYDGGTVQMAATVLPNDATNKAVTWSSDDEEIATVDENGLVTAVAVGSTTITATSVSDNTKSGSATITVKEINTCAAAAQQALTVSGNNVAYNGGKSYTIRGYVTKITYNYSSGNMTFWMDDEKGTEAKSIQCYKVEPIDENNIPEEGDLVEVTGSLTKYNTNPQFAQGSSCSLVPQPKVTVKNDAEEPETITSMAFGNVGQRWQQSFVFGFSYENLEAGDLTMTIGGTNASAFAFYGGELTETVNISSAGSGSVSSLSFRQATEEVGDYEATLTFTGCGLLSPVVIPITMSVKAPEFTYTPATIAFGDVKQHTKATETFTLTGKYLKKNGWSNVKMLNTGIFDPLSEDETYFISSDENGEINETVTVTCDATDAVAGDAVGKLTLKSMELIPEFADKEEVVSFSATVVATYKIEVISPASTGGYVSINGGEPDARTEIYVVDENEVVTITAHPNLGYAFSGWQKGGWPATIADATLATTTVTATGASTINAYFEAVCSPLNAPYLPQSLSTTYNSADLKWQWVLYDDESKVATFHLKATEVNTTNVIEKDITFTTEELAKSDAYYTLTDPELKANTEYEFQVWATTTRDGYCEEGAKSIEASFTTAPYPAATLTLSENGVERAWGEDLRLASEVTLPTAPATYIVDKVFIGWIAESSYSHATDAPANIKKAGEKYTVAAVADKLYAVYATATPGAITTIFSQNFNTCDGTGGNDGSWSGSIASKDLPVLTGWTFASGNAAYQCVKLGTGSAKGSAETPAITMSSNGTLTFRAGAWNSSSEGTTLNLSAENADLDKSSITMTKGEFNSFSATITNVTGNVKIKFEAAIASKNRFFLDDVVIESQGPTTYSNYVTSGPKLLALPTFDPEESETVYTEALEVEISAAEGTIHYTTDGTDPTSESPTYSSAITLNKYGVNTVKAIAIDGDNRSNIATANYKLDLPFASFEDLVAEELYNGDDGTAVVVSFENVEITDVNDNEVYLNVKGSDGEDISIFSNTNHPAGWIVGGKLSGTSIAGTWRANTVVNDYLDISSWTGITYTKPASGLAWSATSATVKKGAKAAVNVYPTLTKPEDLTATITYSSSDESKATIDANGVITLVAAGETTITAQFENDAKYADAEVSYTLTIAPQASVTVTPALLNYGKVKTGTASVNIDILDFKISSENLTEGRAVSIAAPAGFSVTATQLWPPLSANYYITVNIDDATLNTAGVYDGNVVISSDDLEENVIVAVKLTVEDAYAIEEVSEGGWIEWNGSASTPESAFAGTEYTLEAKHDMSHEGGSIKVYKASDDSEVPEEVFDGTTLTMPAYAIKVVATFLLPAANISWESTEPLVLKQSQASNYSNWRILNNAGYSVTVTSSNTDVIATMQPYGNSTSSTIWFPAAVLSTGTTTITATFAGNDNYRETSVSYEVTIENDVPTAIDEVNGETKAVKFIENNQIFIRRGEKVYTIDGALVK